MRPPVYFLIGITAAALASVLITQPTFAQDVEAEADRLTNRALMAWPEERRRDWINGVMVGVSYAIGLHDVEAGRCIARWYFEDDGRVWRRIAVSLEAHPDALPIQVILALAHQSCPGLIPEG